MRYVEARFEENYRDEAYRIYVSKCLQIAPQGGYINMSYTDMINRKNIDHRSGGAIASDIMSRAGLRFED